MISYRQLKYDLEQTILGTIMLERDAIQRVIWLKPENFTHQEEKPGVEGIIHRNLYTAILQLRNERQPIDIITCTDRYLRLYGTHQAYAISEMTNRIGSSTNLQIHALKLVEYSIIDEITETGTGILDDIKHKRKYEQSFYAQDVLEIVRSAQNLANDIFEVLELGIRYLQTEHGEDMAAPFAMILDDTFEHGKIIRNTLNRTMA